MSPTFVVLKVPLEVPHDSGIALLTKGMHSVDPFSTKKRSPLEPVSSRTLMVLFVRGLLVSHCFFRISATQIRLIIFIKVHHCGYRCHRCDFTHFCIFNSFSLLLMILSAKLATLIRWGSVDITLRANCLSNLRHLSTRNPMSLYPDSYSLSELLLEDSYERFLRFFWQPS